MAISEADQLVIDRIKRAIKLLSVAVDEATEAGISVEVHVEHGRALKHDRLIQAAPFLRLTISKEAFVISIPE